MAYSYITTATTVQVDSGPIKKAIIQVNAALTGTITVIDGTTGTTGNVAIITNPGVGNKFEYNTLGSGLRVVTSANCDITAQTIPS